MNHYLNPFEVQKIAKRPLKVMKYSDLGDYERLEDIFEPGIPGVLLLYETKLNTGHWCMLIKHKDRIEFFDSYAMLPDDQIKFTPKAFRSEGGMDIPVLSWLMLYSKYPIEYNHNQFQKWSDKIGTCGRWAGFRYKLMDVPLDDFIEMFSKIGKNSLDKKIVELTKSDIGA